VLSTTWCHGAAGAALTRLRAARLDPSPRLREEAAAAVDACRRAAAGAGADRDASLCHGAAGLGEALLAGGAIAEARALAARHAERLATGELARSGLTSGLPAPSLMVGDAGVAHHLLRLCAPDRVHSVLQVTPPAPLDGACAAPVDRIRVLQTATTGGNDAERPAAG
jgi:lantibiotic modifying enzyme